MSDHPTPETPAVVAIGPQVGTPPQQATPPIPGSQGYDPLLDPRVSQWRDSLLAEAGRKEREIAALKAEIKTTQDQTKPMLDQLAELQKKERERAESELSEVNRHQLRQAEAEKQAQENQAKHEAVQAELTRTQQEHIRERDVWRNEREIIAMFGIRGVYPNEFEQEGLFARLRSLSYQTEEERQQRLTALIDTFVKTKGSNGGHPTTPQIPPQTQTSAPMPPLTPMPPGGSPSRTPQLLEDNYTDFELTQLARTNRELYNKVADQRSAMRRARGVLPVYAQ